MSLDPFLAAPFAIQIHAGTATLALLLGALVLFRRKGTKLHKALGRTWVLLMLVTATSSLFINEVRLLGPFSPTHLFVPMVYGGLFIALREIRRGNVAGHQAAMKGVYMGALLLAGAFTLLPGRRLHDMLFGADSGWTPSLLAIPLALAFTAWLWTRLLPRRPARI